MGTRKITVHQPDGNVEEHEMGAQDEGDDTTVLEDDSPEVSLDEDGTDTPDDTTEDDDEADDTPDDDAATDGEGSETDELSVQIGEEASSEEEDTTRAPEWVRDLRKQHRELQRRYRELEERVKTTGTADPVPKLGKKPALEDFDYDPEKFEVALEKWQDDKRRVAEFEQQQQRELENQQKAWRERLQAYDQSRTQLKVKDFDDAEAFVQDALSVVQQGIIVQGAKNPALVVYALGKNPKKAKELGAINDPVKFAFAVAELEKDLKVINRKKTPPPPPRSVKSSAPLRGSSGEAGLEKLRAEAERTGDYTKVLQYKRRLREQRG